MINFSCALLCTFTLYDWVTSPPSSLNLLKRKIQEQISNILKCLLSLAELRFSSWFLVLYQKKKSGEITFYFGIISNVFCCNQTLPSANIIEIPKRSIVLTEIYQNFAKPSIQIAEPKNIQHNALRYGKV